MAVHPTTAPGRRDTYAPVLGGARAGKLGRTREASGRALAASRVMEGGAQAEWAREAGTVYSYVVGYEPLMRPLTSPAAVMVLVEGRRALDVGYMVDQAEGWRSE